MKKFLTLATLAAVTLTGCNNDKFNDVPAPDAVGTEILFGAKAFTVGTKAPFEGAIAADNKLVALVVGSGTTNDYGTIYKDDGNNEAKGDMTFVDQGQAKSGFPTAVNWPSDGNKTLYFRGFYPGGGFWTIGGATATATVDGKSDLMGTEEVSGTRVSNTLLFGFTHMLTKLHIKVVGTASAATSWGTITNIELVKASNADPAETATLTYSSGMATFSSAADAEIPFFKASAAADSKITYTDESLAPITISTTPTLVAYSMVPPVDASSAINDYTLKITTSEGAGKSGKDVDIALKDMSGADLADLTDGKKFDITINFGGLNEITATATVEEWEDGGTGSGDM